MSREQSPGVTKQRQVRLDTTTSGMLLAGMTTPFVGVQASFDSLGSAPVWALTTATVLSLLLLSAGVLIPFRPELARGMASLGIIGTVALGAAYLESSPFITLAVLLATATALALLWNVAGLRGLPQRRPLHEGRARGAAYAAMALWLSGALLGVHQSLLELVVILFALTVAAGLALWWAVQERQRRRWRARTIFAGAVFCVILLAVFRESERALAGGLVMLAMISSAVLRPEKQFEIERTSVWEPLLGHPERLFVGTFAALCLGGTVLLALPESASSLRSIGFLDALFTSTSAVCVTGLIVLDTPVDFSGFGQAVLLLLIQVGGLGIMTFSTVALWAFGQRMSLRHEGAVARLISTHDRGKLFATAKHILTFTVAVETVGALLLSYAFILRGEEVGMGFWRGLFTSVSAFCNAGFALQSDSLIPYRTEPFVLHVVAALIVLGGLSPLSVFALPALVKRSSLPVSAQARLNLVAAAVLLGVGFLFILAFEWDQSLRDLSLIDRVHNAWFQSVTLRTAGFNSIDIAVVRPATLTLMMLFMFIGGSPGGTAGGIKTTTASVLFLSVVHAIRGQWTLEAFGKEISERTRAKAAVIVSVAAASGIIALVVIQLTQDMPSRWAAFEVVSALGTVGLSIGGTGALDQVGKVVIVLCMFIGRVGGLTLLMFLSKRSVSSAIGRPGEELDVG